MENRFVVSESKGMKNNANDDEGKLHTFFEGLKIM